MSDILDLIDGAIAAVETSPDAMRWTPEPVEDAVGAVDRMLADRIEAFISRAMSVELTNWQRDLLAYRHAITNAPTRPRSAIWEWSP